MKQICPTFKIWRENCVGTLAQVVRHSTACFSAKPKAGWKRFSPVVGKCECGELGCQPMHAALCGVPSERAREMPLRARAFSYPCSLTEKKEFESPESLHIERRKEIIKYIRPYFYGPASVSGQLCKASWNMTDILYSEAHFFKNVKNIKTAIKDWAFL